jgi:ribbon-helix-helix protein
MAERLKAISERTMITQSRLVHRALELLFAEYPEPQPKAGSKRARRRTDPLWWDFADLLDYQLSALDSI